MAALQSGGMPPATVPSAPLRWFLVPLRVLLVTFLLALLSFAVCLFLGILGLVITAAVRGIHPNMTIAYREIAFPAAVLAGAAALVAAVVLEVRHYRPQRNLM
jgi:hypothetical protein